MATKHILLTALIIFSFLFISPKPVQAQSGCCAGHGGVAICECQDGTPLSPTCQKYFPECINAKPQEIITETGYVANVIDGDTIEVVINNKTEKVRLIGIDTPETKHPRKSVECYGPEATEKMKSLVEYKDIILETDPQNANRDKYDRLLRYAYIPNSDTTANIEMINTGHAFAYTKFEFTKKEEYIQAETNAKNTQQGIWADNACSNPGTQEKNSETKRSFLEMILEILKELFS